MKYKKEEIPKEVDTDDIVAHEVVMGEMNIGYEIFNKEMDSGPLFKGLPGDSCQAPYWGYVLKGSFEVRYRDNKKETYGAGYVYYLSPGHVPHIFAGTELIEFSPKEEYARTMEVAAKNMAAMGPR